MGRGSKSHADNPSHDSGNPGGHTPSRQPPDAPAGTHDQAAQTTDTRETSDRSGHDERRRGWFWHWNGIVTQYTPLIGLKGIGLLNSYTVWTDRREDSPHRGYAFPSQQSEANFYGEDRAELITINKILVALDLIEIRKEMIRKTDEQGRRWKVPQNLYRVKDRQNGLDLTAADVLRVIELADRDQAVYRYIRKVFSAKFEPIDPDNVWHQILTEIAEHPTWQKLSAKAAKQEARASARTKAGHRSRAKQQKAETEPAPRTRDARGQLDAERAEMTTGHNSDALSIQNEHTEPPASAGKTSVESSSSGSVVGAAQANNGSGATDEPGSNGSRGLEGGYVADANNGHKGSVEPGNTMYYESSTTTTTTTSGHKDGDEQAMAGGTGSGNAEPDRQGDDRDPARRGERSAAGGPDLAEAGDHPAGGDLVPGAASEGRGPAQRGLADGGGGPLGDPSPLVVSLYEAANDRPPTRLERILLSELERDADAPARAAGASGPEWIAAALREAVGSGSAFVAPKRIREIVNRWAASGSGPGGSVVADPMAKNLQAQAGDESVESLIKQLLDGLLESECMVDVRGNTIVLALDERDAQRIDERRVEDLQRQLSAEIGRRVQVEIESSLPSTGEPPSGEPDLAERDIVSLGRADARQGEQLWGVLLDMLASEVNASDLFRLRSIVPIGERADGVFLLGASTRLAARLLEGRYRGPVERALSSLLSAPVEIAILNQDQWHILDQLS